MLMLTRDAAEVIKELADEAPGAEGVRISTAADVSPDSGGPSFEIELVSAPQADDAVLEAEGAHIFLTPEAAQALDDKVLDAEVQGESVQFAIMEQAGDEPGE